MSDENERPLTGLRVVDLGQVLASPYAGYLLGMLGADVVKVEPPEGDWLRKATPLAVTTQNADKRTLGVDFRNPDAIEAVLRLVESADVFIEGFKPGTAAEMGLSWEAVSARNPRIVYASLSAYGDVGPYAGRPGFDHVVQAVSGIMASTGEPDGPATKVGAPFVDFGSGMLMAFAVLAGLRERDRTDKAVRIDVTMLDAALMLNMGALAKVANSGRDPERLGNNAFSGAVASGMYNCAGGTMIALAANKASQLAKLCALLDITDVLDLPGLDQLEPMSVTEARERIERALQARPASEWESLLSEHGIPAGHVRALSDVVRDGYPQQRGLLQQVASDEGTLLLPGSGIRINGVMHGPHRTVGAIGADNDEVLAEIGFSDAEIAALRASGAVVGP